jgi:hypothetical protein
MLGGGYLRRRIMTKDLITVVAGLFIGFAILVGGFFVVTAQEDDPWFNCYLSGDMQCGQTAVWHGFVNEFETK